MFLRHILIKLLLHVRSRFCPKDFFSTFLGTIREYFLLKELGVGIGIII